MHKMKGLLVIVLVLMWTVGFSQAKIGHINTADLIEQLPEYKEALQKLETQSENFKKQLDKLIVDYRKLLEEYDLLPADISDLDRKDKEIEINQLKERVQAYQEEAEKQLGLEQEKLIKPILENVQAKIQEVAKEKGFDYILDTSSGVVLYFNESQDISELVKKKLNIPQQ